MYDHPRQWEMFRPGREYELYCRGMKRKDNREKINFLCRYVLYRKNIHIPKK